MFGEPGCRVRAAAGRGSRLCIAQVSGDLEGCVDASWTRQARPPGHRVLLPDAPRAAEAFRDPAALRQRVRAGQTASRPREEEWLRAQMNDVILRHAQRDLAAGQGQTFAPNISHSQFAGPGRMQRDSGAAAEEDGEGEPEVASVPPTSPLQQLSDLPSE